MAEVTIPKLGLTMTEGTVAQWLKPTGATVVAGEPVYNLVTDKVEAEVEAEAAGVLHHAVDEGTTAPCGALVGWVLAPGEVPPASSGRAPGTVRRGARRRPRIERPAGRRDQRDACRAGRRRPPRRIAQRSAPGRRARRRPRRRRGHRPERPGRRRRRARRGGRLGCSRPG